MWNREIKVEMVPLIIISDPQILAISLQATMIILFLPLVLKFDRNVMKYRKPTYQLLENNRMLLYERY